MGIETWTEASFVRKYASDIAHVYFDFSSFLVDGETISTATAAADAGLTAAHVSTDGAVVTISLTGGTENLSYDAECRITTSTGQERRWPVLVQVLEDRV